MQKNEGLEEAGPSRRQVGPEATETPGRNLRFSLLEDLVMTRQLGKDILKLLVHAFKRSTIVNVKVAELSSYIIEVQSALGVEDLAHILPKIAVFRKVQARLEVVEKNQAIIAKAMEVLQK